MNKIKDIDEKELELKYSKYGKSFIESYERESLSKRSGLGGVLGESEGWKEFFSDWNNWPKKKKKNIFIF